MFNKTGIMVTNILPDVTCVTWTIWGSEICWFQKCVL